MAGLSFYAAQRVFDLLLNPSTRERAVYVALHRASVDDHAYGSEANCGAYARQPLNSMYSSAVVGASGEVTLVAKNGGELVFPVSTGPDQSFTHWAIWDAAALGEGNVLFSGILTAGRTVAAGEAPYIRDNELTLYFI